MIPSPCPFLHSSCIGLPDLGFGEGSHNGNQDLEYARLAERHPALVVSSSAVAEQKEYQPVLHHMVSLVRGGRQLQFADNENDDALLQRARG